MAEIQSDGGGGGKHQKKGRKKGGNPRVDMTPMVDLAFLLLTFFVLTSNLNKSKTMEIKMPKDVKDTNTTKINDKMAITLLLEGNKEGKVYYYEGKLDENTKLQATTLDPKKGLRAYAIGRNSQIISDMKDLRVRFKKGEMTDTTFRREKLKIQEKYNKVSPFFIVKWGGEAKYGDVINIIDELKIADVEKYALTPITRVELTALSGMNGVHYKELDTPDPAAAEVPKP
ncbi:MAG: biopolymer transporter ExbD [Bacteroidetes bacterium]|jgi:biopolymer transport protein ExbD|nr:biopolymer transporter ExbD [Bacteroidota bacterium]